MIKKIFVLLVIIIIVCAIYFFISANSAANYPAQSFYIEKGDGIKNIAEKLKSKEIIKSKNSFYFYALISGKNKKFVPGDHMLSSNLKVSRIVDELVDVDNVNKETKITILEGWSLKEIANYLEEEKVVGADQFLAAADISLWRDKYDFLQDKKIKNLEGFLFPDTYRIFIGSSPDKIIAKMLDNFQSKLPEDSESVLNARGVTLYQAVTMASVIEKEARSAMDKKMVADVFWKRIKIGMPLQSDATVNYLTGKGETRSKGSDLEIDSPYNTYKYRGLPPGPICNPGFDAINAAINPKANDYLYFITDSSGHAVFAETFEQHKANIAKHLD